MELDTLVRTRRTLHGVAELVLAGPQYRTAGTIKLRVIDRGFATKVEPDLRVEAAELIGGERRIPLSGKSFAELAESVGVKASDLSDVYKSGPGLTPADQANADPDTAAWICQCFSIGDKALRLLAEEQQPILWPEHFDVGVTIAEVNYGVSPGDDFEPEPYAYVGPWNTRSGPFWNAPFGAFRRMRELQSADAVLAFFATGRDLAQAH